MQRKDEGPIRKEWNESIRGEKTKRKTDYGRGMYSTKGFEEQENERRGNGRQENGESK